MKRLGVPIVSAAVALALVGLLAYGLVSRSDDTSIDQAVASGKRPIAASRELPNLGASGTRSIADLRGKVVVVNFWASWCLPCEREAPILDAAQRRLQRSGAGTVLGITFEDATPDSLKFVKKYGVTYPNVRDVGTKLAEQYGTTKLPETFFVDARGRIAALHRGQIDQAQMDEGLARAMQ